MQAAESGKLSEFKTARDLLSGVLGILHLGFQDVSGKLSYSHMESCCFSSPKSLTQTPVEPELLNLDPCKLPHKNLGCYVAVSLPVHGR